MFPGGNSEDEPTRPPYKGRQVGGDAQKVPGLETLETGTHSSTALPAGRRAWRGESKCDSGGAWDVGERGRLTAGAYEVRPWHRLQATRVGLGTGCQTEAPIL